MRAARGITRAMTAAAAVRTSDRHVKRRGVGALLAVVALVVAGGCIYNPAPEGALNAHFRNDSDRELIVELRWERGVPNFRIPARTRGFLTSAGMDDIIVARVYGADCAALGVVELSVDYSLIYVDPEGRVSAHEDDYYFYHPTPYMTELNLFMSERVASCSGA
jgi:hypothetical protein